MKTCTTLNKLKAITESLLIVLFWLALWQIAAMLIDVRFIFPTVIDVIKSLCKNLFTADFWLSIVMSLARISIGFMLGVISGIALAFLALVPFVHRLMTPIITVTRCIPVASFIMILWLLISEPYIPVLIALLMVFPVVWQSAYDSAKNPPNELAEVADAFEMRGRKRLLYLTLPSMLKGTLPGIITAAGLAWKAGVAAEIITYTEHSIGQNIATAKNLLEGADLFAWTSLVVSLSLAVELIIKRCSRKAGEIWEY